MQQVSPTQRVSDLFDDPGLADVVVDHPQECPLCKYSLEGLPEKHACPECGFVYEPNMLVFHGTRPKRKRRRSQIVLICAVVLMVAYVIWMLIRLQKLMTLNLVKVLPWASIWLLSIVISIIFSLEWHGRKWVIARSDGILWRRWPFRPRFLSWLDIGRITDDPVFDFAIIGHDQRNLRQLRNIIRDCNRGASIAAIQHELHLRWLTQVSATAVPAEATSPDRLRTTDLLTTLGKPKRCPTCNIELPDEDAHTCPHCGTTIAENTLEYTAADRPVGPFHWFSLAIAAMIAWAAFSVARDVYYFSARLSIGAALAAFATVIAAMVWNFFRRRPERRLVVNGDGIRWQARDKRSVQRPWETIASIACVTNSGMVLLRLVDGGIDSIPREFLPRQFRGADWAAVLEAARLNATATLDDRMDSAN